jgi:hypothetical protein
MTPATTPQPAPMLVHRFGRFVHRQDPMLIARVVAFKQGKRIEVMS